MQREVLLLAKRLVVAVEGIYCKVDKMSLTLNDLVAERRCTQKPDPLFSSNIIDQTKKDTTNPVNPTSVDKQLVYIGSTSCSDEDEDIVTVEEVESEDERCLSVEDTTSIKGNIDGGVQKVKSVQPIIKGESMDLEDDCILVMENSCENTELVLETDETACQPLDAVDPLAPKSESKVEHNEILMGSLEAKTVQVSSMTQLIKQEPESDPEEEESEEEVNEDLEPLVSEDEIQSNPEIATAAKPREVKKVCETIRKETTVEGQLEILEMCEMNTVEDGMLMPCPQLNEDCLKENDELKSMMGDLKEQLKALKEDAEAKNTILTNILDEMRGFKEIQGKMEEKLDTVIGLSDMRSSFATSSSTSAANAEKVHLGGKLYCLKSSYETITKSSCSHAEWGYALLRGCYGSDAPFMRWRNSPGMKKITLEEKVIISDLYRQWLEKATVEDHLGQKYPKYSSEEVAKLCAGLPSYLGDRAYSLYLQSNPEIRMKRLLNSSKNRDMYKPSSFNANTSNSSPSFSSSSEAGRTSCLSQASASPLTKKRKYVRRGDTCVQRLVQHQQQQLQEGREEIECFVSGSQLLQERGEPVMLLPSGNWCSNY